MSTTFAQQRHANGTKCRRNYLPLLHLEIFAIIWGMDKSPIEDGANVSPKALREMAASLARTSELQGQLADSMERAKVPLVYAKNLKSALGGLVALGKFLGAATGSYCDHVHAQGLQEIEGAVLAFQKYLKRQKDEIQADADEVIAGLAIEKAEHPPKPKKLKRKK
jgi:hypothetical protein